MRVDSLARDKQRAWVAGVCSGFAAQSNIPVALIRLLCIPLAFMSGIVPFVLAYVCLSIYLPASRDIDSLRSYPEPERIGGFKPSQAYYARQESSIKGYVSATDAARRLEAARKRLSRLESYLVSDSYRLDVEFKKLEAKKAQRQPSTV